MISWSWLFYSSSFDQFGDSVGTPVLQRSLTPLTTEVVTLTALGLVLPLAKCQDLLGWQSVHT